MITAAAEDVQLRDTVRLSAEVTPWAAVTVATEATGRVVELAVEVGDRVSKGAVLARIDDGTASAQLAQAEAQGSETEAALAQAELDQRRLKVQGSASQRDRARLEPGLPAAVRVDALPGVVWNGEVRVLGQEVDPGTGTYLVEAAVAEPRAGTGELLLPGMLGSIEVEIGERAALVIPRAALITTADGEGVFAVEGGPSASVVRFLTPEVGATTEDRIEILAGLEAGDLVVVVGQHLLHDGDEVRVP